MFDFDDPMGRSTCVACGECVQACPTGALMPKIDRRRSRSTARREVDREVHRVCPYCGVGCQLSYQIKDDQIAFVQGRNGSVQREPAVRQRPLRLRLRHQSAAADEAADPQARRCRRGVDVDPANPYTHFREASWEEALDVAAKGLAKSASSTAAKRIAGFGSAKGSNEEAYLFQKLVRTGFGTNNVDHCTRLCHASSVAALIEGIGSGAVTATVQRRRACRRDHRHRRQSDREPSGRRDLLQAGGEARREARSSWTRAARRCAATPRTCCSSGPAATWRCSTPCMHVIVEEGLYDVQYMQAYTEDFESLQGARRRLPAGGDGGDLRHRRQDDARGRAHLRAAPSAAIIFWGMGISQHVHGTDNARCLIALALIVRPGRPAGHGPAPAARPEQRAGRLRRRPDPDVLPDYQVGRGRRRPAALRGALGHGARPQAGLTVVEIMDAVHAGEIRGMYIMGENPAMSDPDVEHAREALAKLEHLVVQDIFLTETAKYADVVLPASAWPEKDGTVTNTNRQVQMGRKALPLPGEARQDWWIIIELGRRLGLTGTTPPREVFAEMKRRCRRSRTSPGSGSSARARSPTRAAPDEPGARRSSSATASRPRPGAASSCRPRSCRRPRSRTPSTRSC